MNGLSTQYTPDLLGGRQQETPGQMEWEEANLRFARRLILQYSAMRRCLSDAFPMPQAVGTQTPSILTLLSKEAH